MSPSEVCFGNLCCMHSLHVRFSQNKKDNTPGFIFLLWIAFTCWPSDKAISRSVTSCVMWEVLLHLYAVAVNISPWWLVRLLHLGHRATFSFYSLDNVSGLYFSAVFIPCKSNERTRPASWKLLSLSGVCDLHLVFLLISEANGLILYISHSLFMNF